MATIHLDEYFDICSPEDAHIDLDVDWNRTEDTYIDDAWGYSKRFTDVYIELTRITVVSVGGDPPSPQMDHDIRYRCWGISRDIEQHILDEDLDYDD